MGSSKPDSIMYEGERLPVYGRVSTMHGDILVVFVHESDDWPRIPVSVGTVGGGTYDVKENPREVINWRNRGDLRLTAGNPRR